MYKQLLYNNGNLVYIGGRAYANLILVLEELNNS